MKDVYITDHAAPLQKLITHSAEEDEAFYKYQMALNAYKAEAPKPAVARPRLRYEKGSLAQRMFDPMAGATKDEEGTLVYTVEDKEILGKLNEKKLRKQFELFTD